MNKILQLINGLKIKKEYSSFNRDPSIWVFGEWFGERCYDNCLCLANYLAENHPEIHIFWASKKATSQSILHPRIKQLLFDDEYTLKVYKSAGVVVMNQGLGDFSSEGVDYFFGGIKVNLWHGVMWKKVGHDGSSRSNFFYNIYTKINDYIFGADYYLALSEKYADICISAFGIDPNNTIKAGYPRNAIFYNSDKIKQKKKEIIDILRNKTGKNWSYNTKIITYMPTFRDGVNDIYSCERLAFNQSFVRWLEKYNVVILQKAHFISQKRNGESHKSKQSNRIIPFNSVDPQTLLAATDLLITDYSSCFFDFLLLDRPIIHFLYDYDYYLNADRGLYYRKEDVVCGDTVMDEDKLAESIIKNLLNPANGHELRKKRRIQYMTYEKPDSCETIYRSVVGIQKKNN